MKINQSLYGFLLISGMSFAGQDPIQWTVLESLPSPIYVNVLGQYKATYRFTNRIPFKMVSPLYIKKTANPESEFQFIDNCSGKKLGNNQSCLVEVYLNPTSSGTKSFALTEVYGNNEVPLPGESRTATGGGTGSTLITGTTVTNLTSPLVINTASPWEFTFQNTGTEAATGVNLKVSVNGSNTSNFQTTCGQSISPGAPPCYVKGNFTPPQAGAYTIAASLSYTQSATPVEENTSSSTNSDGSGGLVCTAAVPFAPEIVKGSTNVPITLLCTNKTGNKTITFNDSNSGSANLQGGTFRYTNPGTDIILPGYSAENNCNSTETSAGLNPGDSCQLTGFYNAPNSAAPGVSIGLSVSYNITGGASSQTASTSTSTNVVNEINNSRIINLVNNCPFPVWWGMVGGAVTGGTGVDCPSGSYADNGRCLYNGTAPTSGSYYLPANTGTAQTKIIQTAASTISDSVLWKGLVSGQTVCADGKCGNNDCGSNGGTTQCTLGFEQPATEAEFTLLLTGSGKVDTYDITQVNGFSIPMSMSTNQTVSEYSCGTAGATTAQGSLPAANYSAITPPSSFYYWVSNEAACLAGNTCSTAGYKCGLAFVKSSNSFAQKCGKFLGFWSANQICQTDPNFSITVGSETLNCASPISSPSGNTLTSLLKCSPPNSAQPPLNSCYLSYPGASNTSLAQCCGCTNWSGIASPSANCPTNQTNPSWTSSSTGVLPLISWMKSANPTGYAYPYDDKASTFQCSAAADTVYTITFCPGGQTGNPTGIDNGHTP